MEERLGKDKGREQKAKAGRGKWHKYSLTVIDQFVSLLCFRPASSGIPGRECNVRRRHLGLAGCSDNTKFTNLVPFMIGQILEKKFLGLAHLSQGNASSSHVYVLCGF